MYYYVDVRRSTSHLKDQEGPYHQDDLRYGGSQVDHCIGWLQQVSRVPGAIDRRTSSVGRAWYAPGGLQHTCSVARSAVGNRVRVGAAHSMIRAGRRAHAA